MLQLRYNGCADCKNTAEAILRACGYFVGKNYSVEMHSDHAKDRIYRFRGDYLKSFTGAILYNTETEHWYDFYDKEGKTAMLPNTPEKKEKLTKIFQDLNDGK